MANNKYPIIETEYGPVKGVRKTTALGRNIYDFRAIPYMKGPIGKLRFRDAQPPDHWNEPFDSNIERPTYFCPPFPPFPADGQEDAGIVSISTPYLDRKLPVLGMEYFLKSVSVKNFMIFQCIYMVEVSKFRLANWIHSVEIICSKRMSSL